MSVSEQIPPYAPERLDAVEAALKRNPNRLVGLFSFILYELDRPPEFMDDSGFWSLLARKLTGISTPVK